MASINVKLPQSFKEEVESFLADNPYYLNKSELVRDALRHFIDEERRLSKKTLQAIESGKAEVEKDGGHTLDEVRKELDG